METEKQPKKGALFFVAGLCGFLLIATVGLLISTRDFSQDSSAISIVAIDRIISMYPDEVSLQNLNTFDREALINSINQGISLLRTELVSIRTLESQKLFQLDELKKDKVTISDLPDLQKRLEENNKTLKTRNSLKSTLTKSYKSKAKQCRRYKGAKRRSCNAVATSIQDSIKQNNEFITEIKKNISDIQSKIDEAKNNKVDSTFEIDSVEKELKDLRLLISQHNTRINNLSDIRDRLSEIPDNTPSGCTDPGATNFDSNAVNDDQSCTYEERAGCVNPGAINYDPSAIISDGSCEYPGCTDSTAINYDSTAKEDDGSCQYEEQCSCNNTSSDYPGYDLEEVRKVKVNITSYGGPDDSTMGYNEPVSITGELARNLNPNDIYTAWPISKGEKEHDLNLQACLAPDSTDGSMEGEGTVNDSLRDSLDVEISYTDSNGVKKTVTARANDRGPGDTNRWDASRGLWKALGLENVLDGNPNDPNNQVELEIRVVPRSQSCAGS